MVRAAFVDRDGVIDQLVTDEASGVSESPLRAEDVALIGGAPEALRRLAAAGWMLVGISNQPAAAKGTASLQELEAVQDRVLELLAEQGVRFGGFHICWHHPEGVVPELSGACECRKPAPGLLLAAARELHIDLNGSWMIGDTDADVLAGQAAGCRTVLVENPHSAHKRDGRVHPDEIAPSLGEAVELVLKQSR